MDVLEDYQRQLQQFEDDLAYGRIRENAERMRADKKSREEHLDSLADLETQSAERIEGIRSEALDAVADAWENFNEETLEANEQLTEELTENIDDLNKATDELNKRFFEDSKEDLEDHHKSVAKAEKDYAKERLRRLQDMQDDLFSAELANDALAFIQAEDTARKDLERSAEDHSEEMSESETDFQEMRAEKREQFQTDLQDLRDQANERRLELETQHTEEAAERQKGHQETLVDIRAQAAERRTVEQEELIKSILEMKAAYRERRAAEKEEREWQEMWRERDLERQRQQMEQAAMDRITEAQNREAQILQVITSGGQLSIAQVEQNEAAMRAAQLQSYRWALNQIQTMQSSMGSGTGGGGGWGAGIYGSGSGSGGYSWGNMFSSLRWGTSARTRRGAGGGGRQTLAAAEGALIDRPTLLIAGEGRYPEMVIPFDKSRGIPKETASQFMRGMYNLPMRGGGAVGGGGGGTFHWHGDISVGEGVQGWTKAEIQYQFHLMGSTVVRAISDARAGTAR
jgi:hypothetical protein